MSNHTPTKIYPINFSGFIRFHDGPFYEDKDILDADQVGMHDAIQHGNRIAACYNALTNIPDPEQWVADMKARPEMSNLESINDFIEWVSDNYSHVKGGFRHRGDFYRNDKPVPLRALLPHYAKKP